MSFKITVVFSFLFYLALSAGSGNLGLWSGEELVFALLFAVISAALVSRIFNAVGLKPNKSFLSPKRWVLLIAYVAGPLFVEMAKANLDVAYRVLTGKIKPGIVKIPSGLKTNFGTTLLANSITLTPGTLTVDVDDKKNLYVHWIYVKKKEPDCGDICSNFPDWIRRIAE